MKQNGNFDKKELHNQRKRKTRRRRTDNWEKNLSFKSEHQIHQQHSEPVCHGWLYRNYNNKRRSTISKNNIVWWDCVTWVCGDDRRGRRWHSSISSHEYGRLACPAGRITSCSSGHRSNQRSEFVSKRGGGSSLSLDAHTTIQTHTLAYAMHLYKISIADRVSLWTTDDTALFCLRSKCSGVNVWTVC